MSGYRQATTDLAPLRDLVARLRGPGGCPWDREQTLATIRAYLVEEAHELAAALDTGDWREIGEELGDLLFQAAFVTRLGEEAGALELGEVLAGIQAKMVERHPHVFGGETLPDAAAVAAAWERRKAAAGAGGGSDAGSGKEGEAGGGERRSLLAGVPATLPALLAAYRLTQKAAGVGFDWPEAADVLAKLDEEVAELKAELAGTEGGDDAGGDRVAEELGDLLLTVANLARKLGVDPEAALAAANRKFRERFGRVEAGLAERGSRLGEATLAEMDALWEAAKANPE